MNAPTQNGTASAAPRIPPRLKVARAIVRHWPLPRGAYRAERLLLSGFRDWPDTADFSFEFGRFVGASLAEWPRGFRELFLHGVLERTELRVWRALLRQGEQVVDGGANWGYWSLAAAALTGPGGTVIAFEPVPSTAAALRRNLAASGVTTVRVMEQALGAAPGTLELHLYDDDPFSGGTSAGLQPGRPVRGHVKVPVTTLDQVVADAGVSPTLIKLDVEGGEVAALQGARGLLTGARPPVVCFEWNEDAATALGVHPSTALEGMRALGFDAYLAAAEGLVPFAIPANTEGWIPMVWCLPKSGELRGRLAHLVRG